MVVTATTFPQAPIRTPGLARTNVPEETTEHGRFETVVVTKTRAIWIL